MAAREVLVRAVASAALTGLVLSAVACDGDDAALPSVATTAATTTTTTTTTPLPTTSVEYITAAATLRPSTTEASPTTDPAEAGADVSVTADCRISRVVRRGERGDDVACVQQALNAWLAANGVSTQVAVDGLFGPGTEAAVKDMQQRAGLGVDGLVGPATGAALAIWG